MSKLYEIVSLIWWIEIFQSFFFLFLSSLSVSAFVHVCVHASLKEWICLDVAIRLSVLNTCFMCSTVDFATAMAYDFHLYIKNKDVQTGYNSPLFTTPGDPTYFSAVSENTNDYI